MSVVLGYDESPGAARALRIAIEVAAAYGEELVLVYGAA
ncbi:universal stress protein, partial [Streptomyces sp. SID8455]|nr:universal stress protein [Streptomyces sp. SID8455]